MNRSFLQVYWYTFWLGALNVIGTFFYYHEITIYLSSLQRPIPLEFTFLFSLALSVLMHLRYGLGRFVAVELTATVLVFTFGILIAEQLRIQYLSLSSFITSQPKIEDMIGTDYYTALTNPAIGYGSCFAMGLSFSRLFIWRKVRGILRTIFMRDCSEQGCPCCGTVVKKQLR